MLVQKCDLDSQSREHGGVLQPDDAGADHHQIARHILQAVKLVGVKNSLCHRSRFQEAVRRAGAAGDKNILAAHQLRTLLAFDLDGVRIDESRIAFQGRDMVAAQLRFDHIDFTGHRTASARQSSQTRSDMAIRSFSTYPRP